MANTKSSHGKREGAAAQKGPGPGNSQLENHFTCSRKNIRRAEKYFIKATLTELRKAIGEHIAQTGAMQKIQRISFILEL